MGRAKNLLVLRGAIAAIIVIAFTLLSSYCRYVLEHHPHHWDTVVATCAAAQGLIFGISMMAMASLLAALFPRLR
jgi:MFS family permease